MDLSVVELFAGVGGFRVGLNNIKNVDEKTGRAVEEGNWNIVWANQFEPATKTQHAFDCYITRFGSEDCSNIDINKVDKSTIPNHSLLVGGFPCQDYSVARSLSNEKGIEGKKGVLFWDIKDIISVKKSPFVLLENVDRLLKSPANMRGRDFAIMLKTFDDLGYYVVWRVINASEYAMPQKRRRVFIFAFRKNTKYAKWFKKQKTENKFYKNILNKTFEVDASTCNICSMDLNKYEDVLDVSNNFKDGKFLISGFMMDGNVYHSDVKAKMEELYSLKQLIDNANEFNPKDKSNYIVDNEKLDKWKYLKGAKKIERTSKTGHKYIYSEGSMFFPENMNEPARTMLTSEGTLNRSSHIIFDKEINKYRILTPIECEMIQMFPPNWTNTDLMTERKRYFMMGNALVTGIISRLEPELRNIIEKE